METKKSKCEQLQALIKSNMISQALLLVSNVKDYCESGALVAMVLAEKNTTQDLKEGVLQAFFDTRVSQGDHKWVSQLKYFTEALWRSEMYDWIKKFNQACFECCKDSQHDPIKGIIKDFGNHAKYNHNPVDFFFTPENLIKLKEADWNHLVYAKARIEIGVFNSQKAFLQWQLEMQFTSGQDLNQKEIQSILQQLHELQVDTSEFSQKVENLLNEQLHSLQVQLSIDKKRVTRLIRGIQETEEFLASLRESVLREDQVQLNTHLTESIVLPERVITNDYVKIFMGWFSFVKIFQRDRSKIMKALGWLSGR